MITRSTVTRDGASVPTTFAAKDNVRVLTDDGRDVVPGSDEDGVLAVAGRLPLGYHHDPDAATARMFREVDGVRYATPGDRARVLADGRIELLGRGSACINTGGEKVYPEEVEQVLRQHPAVVDAAVVGVPDARWGEMVTALVERGAGLHALDDSLREHARDAPRRVQGAEAVPHGRDRCRGRWRASPTTRGCARSRSSSPMRDTCVPTTGPVDPRPRAVGRRPLRRRARRSSTATPASPSARSPRWPAARPGARWRRASEPGDRVAIWAPNSWEWIVAALGALGAGAWLVPVNTRFKGDEAAYVLERADAAALFTVRGFLDTDYVALLRDTAPDLRCLDHVVLPGGRARRRARPSTTTSPPATRSTRPTR